MDTTQEELIAPQTEIKDQVVLTIVGYPQMYRLERLVDASTVTELMESSQQYRANYFAHLGSLVDSVQDFRISIKKVDTTPIYSEFN